MQETTVETKTCRHCNIPFSITDVDIAFYDKISPVFAGKKYQIPTPTFCPNCRAQNILSTRNERNLYKRKCSLTGKEIVSIHSPDKPFPVYDQNVWWGDSWNPLSYGVDVDLSRSFIDQFIELFNRVPKISLNAPMSQNSEFTNQCQGNRDSYMMFCSGSNENCYYGMWNQECKFCCDCLYIEFCEHCYEVINAIKCYNCNFSKNIEACSNVWFSRDVVNCQDCLFCVNLQNKQYNIFNKQYTKEAYFTEKERLVKNTFSSLQNAEKSYREFSLQFPVKYYQGKRNENFSGDYIQNSKDAYVAFNCRDNDVSKYCRDSWRVVKSYDLIETLVMEYCIEVEGTSYANSCFFCAKLSKADRVFYSSHCNGVQELFGCVGVNNKSYCILNKQYTKEEYEQLVPKIIEGMRERGEWGHFFPPSISPFGYNETVAQEYFPLSRDEVVEARFIASNSVTLNKEERGNVLYGRLFNWSDYEIPFPKVEKLFQPINFQTTFPKSQMTSSIGRYNAKLPRNHSE